MPIFTFLKRTPPTALITKAGPEFTQKQSIRCACFSVIFPSFNNTEIPLNTAGDMVRAPYRFIAGLTIRREDIYEEEREGD